jgi:hypothetical protein
LGLKLIYYNVFSILKTIFSSEDSSWSNDEYSFGFIGKDKESEFNIGAYDFGARIHDARLGR